MASSVAAEPQRYLEARIRWRPIEIAFWLATLTPFVLTPNYLVLASQIAQGAVTEGVAIVIGSVVLFSLVVTRMAQLVRQVEAQARLAGVAAAVRSQPYYLDVTHPQANKGHGVRAICRRLGLDPQRLAVIGDMANDLSMFTEAGLAIAMGQSPEPVRAAADAVTTANTEEGFAEAVRRYVLPRAAVGRPA